MKLPLINVERAVFSNFEKAIQKEWLVTNGLGGYASSTVLSLNTRKYHGLLVAALHPPGDRRVLLTKLDEEISLDDIVWRLGVNEFNNAMFPEGHRFLDKVSMSPFPTFHYVACYVDVFKRIFMPHEKNAVVTLYNVSNRNDEDVNVRVFPLLNSRSFHEVTDRNKFSKFSQDQRGDIVSFGFKNPESSLLIKATGKYFTTGHWIDKIYLREEACRGESCFDDCYQPGYFETTVGAEDREDFAVIAVAEETKESAAAELKELPVDFDSLKKLCWDEANLQEKSLMAYYSSHADPYPDDWLSWLILATNQFIVRSRGEGERSVIAGYHWFGPWGRDTFISMPGLALIMGKFDVSKAIFLEFAKFCKNGLIPNFIPEKDDKPAYNTVDAALWYINALLQYLKYTGDFCFVEQHLWKILKSVIQHHFDGTLFGIHLGDDGLLSHGPQLTWMDSSVAGSPVFPRAGKAVEIQALWYNALKTMELLAARFSEDRQAEEYSEMAEKTRRSFAQKFWIEDKDYLYDVISGSERDDSMRPNQILTASLDFSMLSKEMHERIVDTVQKELLTPCGLRTLSRSDPRYIGIYSGNREKRDRAYHSGTVWPWLLGPFVTAYLKSKGFSEPDREYVFQDFLKPLLTNQVYMAGMGTLSEIYDGDPPHTPRGCIAQAWSVAEPLRAYVEDVLLVRPSYEKGIVRPSR
jgi:predicted glycogen debranching enzyme